MLRLWLAGAVIACGCSRDDIHLPAAHRSGATPGDGHAGQPASGGSGWSADGPQPGLTAVAGVSGGANRPGSATTNHGGMPPVIQPVDIDETGANNPAGLAPDEVAKLIAGGPANGKTWLYPYEGTVFPRGTIAPALMWEGDAAADAFYLHMQGSAFNYRGILKATPDAAVPGSPLAAGLSNARNVASRPVLQIPQSAWVKAGLTVAGKAEEFTVEVTERANGAVSGPMRVHFSIASGAAIGSVYYSNYTDVMGTAGMGGGYTGKIMRIPPGGIAQEILSAPPQQGQSLPMCPGCHAVSANGARMSVQWSDQSQMQVGQTYGFTGGGATLSAPDMVGRNVAFAALYPDGTKYLSSSTRAWSVGTVGYYLMPLIVPLDADSQLQASSVLRDSTSGEVIADTGIPTTAGMPMFSPDGSLLVFNDMGVDGHNLTLMKYDVTTNKAGESRTLYQEPDSMSSTRPGFPCVLPDNGGVVFVRTDSPDFTGQRTGGFLTTASANVTGAMPASDSMLAPVSDLYLVDVASGTSVLLAQAMGFNSQADADAGKTYLPFGQGDLHHNFIPSVSPVAQGGYFWVFFDSLRNFGHLGLQRQLWVAALDIQPDGKYTQDVSHPPFYLPGQAFGVGNHRAFATLDECRPVGASCTTGIDCCAGTTCNIPDSAAPNDFGVPVGTCGAPPPTGCSAVDERCASTADCCDLSDYCINGFCAWIDLL